MSQAATPTGSSGSMAERSTANSGSAAKSSEGFFAPLLGLIGVASAALTGALSGSSGFFLDDFWTLGEARDHGLSLHYLLLPVTGDHVHPGRRLADWVVLSLGPEWWVAGAFMTLCLAATVVLAGVVTREIADSAVTGLLCAAIVGGSVAFLRSSVWWSSGVQEFPAAALSLLMVLFALRWQKTRNTWFAGLSAASLFAALCFFDKYASMAAVAAVLVVVARPPERSITKSELKAQIRANGVLIIALFAVVLAITFVWLVSITGAHDPFGGKTPGASPSRWLSFLGSWWAHGVGGVMLNANTATGPNLGLDPTPSIDHFSWIGLLLIGLLAAATVRGSRAMAIWFCAAAIVTLNAVVVGTGRLGEFGSAYLLDPRYQDLTVLTLVLLVPAAWRASGKPSPNGRLAKGAFTVGLIALAGIWVVNGSRAIDSWARLPRAAGDYATEFRASLESAVKANPNTGILDEAAPNTVVGPVAVSPYNSTGRLAALVAPDVDVTVNSPAGQLVRFANDGQAEPASAGRPARLDLSQPNCGKAARSADWHHSGAFTVTASNAAAPKPGATDTLYSIELHNTNRTGQVAVFPTGSPYPISTLPLSRYPTGMRVLIPAGRGQPKGGPGVTVKFWQGAAGCVTHVTSAVLP